MKINSIFIVVLMIFINSNTLASEVDDFYEKGIAAQDKQDYELAIKWLTKAAEEIHTDAQINLAKIYQSNEKFKNDKEAYRWYQSAAYHGNSLAQIEVSKYIQSGEVTRQDNFMAYVWLRVAVHYGAKGVEVDIARLAKLFSSEDIEIAIIERDKKIFQIEQAMARFK
ncbi:MULTISPECIES: tetratricopeptide repeat protein [Colwellia]|uniref:Secretory immunoglobulin A-binding protein EsiB n=1 Tax=Colwellia marinimaniae TaxID=1513592 RepID=A0ABQ0MZ99_9GAMM|nr:MULTISPECIES: tetratricopeptide repeat protein [Colwellia]GAW97698.1 hypothetical protein MTCD1_03338 [Colwellia marinimaniae]